MRLRLRAWLGAAATIASAAVEHWLGETVAVAVLTAAVVLVVGVLWRRVSILMATGGSTNCAKAYDVDDRLSNYMTIMAPLSPIVVANASGGSNPGNAAFLAGLKQMSAVTAGSSTFGGGAGCSTSTGDFNTTAINDLETLQDIPNNIISVLQGSGYMAL
jgi:hypothetical protein